MISAFAVLNVTVDTPDADIKSAYRRAALDAALARAVMTDPAPPL